MRDVVTGFYAGTLRRLIADGEISLADSVLVVCGGPLDHAVMQSIGFRAFTVTNITENCSAAAEDAENLPYADDSFDVVIVHAGLHHCHSPHRALLEMYRVSRKWAVSFESRDSLIIRTAVLLGLTMDYETNAISPDGKTGGVADTGVPNFIYRWTERDVKNTIASYDPSHVVRIRFFYDLRLPIQRFTNEKNRMLKLISRAIEPLSQIFAFVFPKQCNEFAFAVAKGREFQPWIKA